MMRKGKIIYLNEPVHEDAIKLCEQGLHASLTPLDATNYKPNYKVVLTKVLVWGNIIVDKDKLVATDRMIVGVIE